MKKNFTILFINRFREIYSIPSVILFIILLILSIITFSDIVLQPFGSSLITNISSEKAFKFAETVVPLIYFLVLSAGIELFIPIGFASLFYMLTDLSFVNYFLARPIKRSSFILSNLLAAFLFLFSVTLSYSIFILVIIKIKTGTWFFIPIFISCTEIILRGIAINTLLLFIIITSNSLNISITLIFIHNFFIQYLLNLKIKGSSLIEKLLAQTFIFMKYIFPQKASLTVTFFKGVNTTEILLPFLLKTFLSVIIFSLLTVYIYKHKEF